MQPLIYTNPYRYYVLGILTVVYTLSFLDRQLMAILLEPIKNEFQFSDTAMGLLTGFAFALFYTTLGVPIARYADGNSRVNVITASLFVWSLFTALTGMVRNFFQIFTARILVGVGEAGCNPAAYSLLGDYFPKEKRSTAMGIYSTGAGLGIFLGFLMGGEIQALFGWRAAFLIAGIPGIILAVIVKLTIRSIPRGFSEGTEVAAKPPPLKKVFRQLIAKRSFFHVSVAAGLHTLLSFGVGNFFPSFLIRVHGFSVAEVGRWLSFIVGFGILLGLASGGILSDYFSKRFNDQKWQLYIPAWSSILSIPFGYWMLTTESSTACLVALGIHITLMSMFLGPNITTVQNLVYPRARAVASAIFLMITNLIGMGLGPSIVGYLSDLFHKQLEAGGMAPALAKAEGLRDAMLVTLFFVAWCALHYFLACRTLNKDLETE